MGAERLHRETLAARAHIAAEQHRAKATKAERAPACNVEVTTETTKQVGCQN